ncbi:MAG: EamA family transporter [Candidatus Dormibacteraeota bacterium]|nr:EamA family transporter [Candidatus Dormibacteraeota bacterium]
MLFTRALSFAFPPHAAPDLAVENEVYLLYMLQPFFGVLGARLVLRERRRPYFWLLALLASGGVYLIVFAPDPGAPFSSLQHGQAEAALLIIGAVVLWASGTVLGRYLLYDVSFVTTTAMRFALALPVLLLLTLFDTGIAGLGHYSAAQIPSFLGIALIPGLLAMLIYYRALSRTPASLATFAELGYPCALFLVFSLPPPVGLGAPLHVAAILGAIALVIAVTALNALKGRDVVRTEPTQTRLAAQGSAIR